MSEDFQVSEFCPKCDSDNIGEEKKVEGVSRCKDCNYIWYNNVLFANYIQEVPLENREAVLPFYEEGLTALNKCNRFEDALTRVLEILEIGANESLEWDDMENTARICGMWVKARDIEKKMEEEWGKAKELFS